jgi:hypothetical protein
MKSRKDEGDANRRKQKSIGNGKEAGRSVSEWWREERGKHSAFMYFVQWVPVRKIAKHENMVDKQNNNDRAGHSCPSTPSSNASHTVHGLIIHSHHVLPTKPLRLSLP